MVTVSVASQHAGIDDVALSMVCGRKMFCDFWFTTLIRVRSFILCQRNPVESTIPGGGKRTHP